MGNLFDEEKYDIENSVPSNGNDNMSKPDPIMTNLNAIPGSGSVEYTGRRFSDYSIFDEGIPYSQATTPQGIEQYRHEQQPWYSSLGSALNQAIVGEIAGGTVEGLGYLLDMEQYGNLVSGTEKEFGNWFSDLGKDMKTWAQEATPIYADPTKQGEFSPEDWSWWMTNLPSVASTLSLMVPSGAAVKGLSALGKATGIASKLGKGTKWAAKGISQAVISRHMENMMEASQTAEELRKLSGTQITSDQAQKIRDSYGVDLQPSGWDDSGNAIFTIDDNIANEIAAKGASNSYKANWAMVLQDIPQYLLLNKPFGKVTEDLSVGLAKKLGKDVIPVVANKAKAIGLDMLGEGGEEAYQYMVGERSKELALADAGLIDKRDLSDAISSYLTKGDMWTSAFFGAMGAGVMQTAGKSVSNLLNRVKGVESADESRIKDVDEWSKRVQMYNDLISAAEQSGNPEQFNSAKEALLVDMAIKSAQNGNLGYMIESLEGVAKATDEEQSTFGITPEMVAEAKKNNPKLIANINRIGELYQSNLDKFGPEQAALLTHNDFRIESASEELNKVESDYNSKLSSIPNFHKASKALQDLTKLNADIDANNSLLDVLNSQIEKTKDADLKKTYERNAKAVESKIADLTKQMTSIEYSKEDKAADKNISLTSPALDEFKSLAKKKAFAEQGLASAQQDVADMKKPSYKRKAAKKRDLIENNEVKNVTNNATSTEELKDIKDKVKGTPKESVVEETISEKAKAQQINQAAEGNDIIELDIDPSEYTAVTQANAEAEQAAQEFEVPDIDISELTGIQEHNIEAEQEAKDIYSKKADIKKRRQEELNVVNNLIKKYPDESDFLSSDRFTINSYRDPQTTKSTSEDIVILQYYTNNKEFNGFLFDFFNSIPNKTNIKFNDDEVLKSKNKFVKSIRIKNKNYYKTLNKSFGSRDSSLIALINAKYDAELAALEKTSEKVSEPNEHKSSSISKRYYDKEGNQLAHKLESNLTGLKNVVTPLASSNMESKMLVNQLNSVSTPEQLDSWLNTVREYRDDGRKVQPIIDAVKQYYKKSKEVLDKSESSKVAKENIGVAQSVFKPTEDKPIDTSIYKTDEKKVIVNRPRNNPNRMYIKLDVSVENTAAVNLANYVPGLDVEGLNKGDYKAGQKVYFEVDKTTEYMKDSAQDRGIRIVVYKDGDVNNKSAANRKVVGGLGRASSEKINSTKSAVESLRNKIFEDINSKYDKSGDIVTSKYSSTIAGFKVDLSRTETVNSPLDILVDEHKDIDDFKSRGGFIIGISNTINDNKEVSYPKTGIQPHKTYTDHNGQIMIATQNPHAPEHLVMRGFVKKLGDYGKTNKENHDKIVNRLVDIIKTINPDGSNFRDVKNELNKYLYVSDKDFNYDPRDKNIVLFGANTITLDDVNSGKTANLISWLDGLHFSIDKNLINSKTAALHDMPYGRARGKYNELVNEFIGLNIKPKQYFENTAALISLDINEEAEKAIKKSAEVTKKVVADNKVDIQPEIVKEDDKHLSIPKEQEVSDTVSSATKKKRTRKAFDTGLGDTSNGLKVLFNEGKNLPKARRAEPGNFERFDKVQELAWLSKNFPGIKVGDLNEISGVVKEILKSGEEAWGAFHNAAIYLADNAAVGTAYHEAFHVIFNLALDEKQRKAILKGVEGKDDIEKEETLADLFMDQIISDQADKSLSKQIRDFFRKIALIIKSLFTNKVSGIEEFAFRANNGFYAKPSVKFGKFESKITRLRLNGWSYRTEKAAIEAINMDLLNNVIPNLRASNNEFSNMSDVEIMNAFSKTKGNTALYKQVYNNFLKVLKDEDVSLTEEQEELIEDLLDFMFEEDGSIGKLVYSSMRALDYNNGIKVSIKEIAETAEDGQEQADQIDNEESLKENWQIQYTQRSSKSTAPYEVKKFIRYLKTGKVNEFGLPEYVDYDDAYNGLLADLSGSVSLDEMKEYLNDMSSFNPYYNDILNKIENDDVFASKFFNTFSVTHSKYAIMFEKDGRYILTDANRRGIINTIITDWTNSILSTSNILKLDKNGEYTIDTELAGQVKARYDKLMAQRELSDEDLSTLFKLTKYIGFEIPERVFAYVNSKGLNNEFLTGQRSLQTIVNKFAEGKNPFDAEAGLDVSESESIRRVAKITKKAMPQLFESRFENIDGEFQYSHLVQNFLSKLTSQLHTKDGVKRVINQYQQDKLFKANIILNELNDISDNESLLEETFDFSIVDGLNDKTTRTGYPSMTKSDLQVMSINSYFNNGNKNYSYYRGPVLSDAGNMLLFKFKRYDIDTVTDNLIQLAEAEYLRIKKLQDASGLGIKNYDNSANASFETGYHIVPMFNGFKGSPLENYDKASKVVEKWFNTKIEAYKSSLVSNKVLVGTEDGNIDFEKSRIDNRIANQNFNDFIAEFYYNDFLMRANFSLLTIGDPAFYNADDTNNKVVDYTKRAKEIYSPKFIPNTDATYEDENGIIKSVSSIYKTIYLKDAKIAAPSLEGITSTVDNLVKEGIMTESQAKVIKVSYSEVNQTDAQAYTTLPFYRETMVSLGRWTDKHKEAYPRLMRGEGTAQDIALVMQPLKPFMYTQIYNPDLKAMVPIQNKNSEYLLLPQLFNNNNNNALKSIHDHMIENNIGVANFASAVKAGLYGATPVLDENGAVDMSKLSEAVIHEIPMVDRGIQMETPEHFRDSDNLFGTQIRKIIMSDLVEGVYYDVTGWKSVKAKELYDMYERIILEDLKEAYEDAYSQFTEDGNINWRKIHELLLDEARSRGKGEEFEKAIEYDEANDRLKLPLFHPLYANVAENLLTSVFKNRVTKQKINGGAFVQATSFGLSRELKLVFNGDSLQHAEVMLPAWSKQFYQDFVNSDGTIDFEQVEKSAPELLEMIGYRIPTEDKYSMLPLKVVGFLPLEAGGAIMLPAEITTISGSDFDVDKMYVMMKAFTRKEVDYKAIKDDLRESFNKYKESNPETTLKPNMSLDNIKIVLQQAYTGQELNKEDMFIYDFYNQNKSKYGELVQYEADKMDYSEGAKNSKSARNNAKLDLMTSVLRNKTTIPSLLTPGGYDNLQKIARLVESRMKQSGDAMTVFDIDSVDEMSIRNMAGKALVGIAANHTSHHALRQHFDLELTTKVTFDNKPLTKLGGRLASTKVVIEDNSIKEVLDSSDIKISRNLSEFSAAVVDNAKDPLAAFINYSTFTADTISLIVSLGFAPETAILFATQPVILELTKRVMENKDSSPDAIIRELAESIGLKMDANVNNINTEDMFNALGDENISTDLQRDVLIAFNQYSRQAKDLGKLIRASRADTKGLGPTMADGESILSLISDLGDRDFSISGTETMFSTDNLIQGFTEYGVKSPMKNVMEKILPYNSRLYSNIKDSINFFVKGRDLSVDQRNSINRQVMSFYLSGFDFFNEEDRGDIVKNLPKKFFKFLEENPQYKSNALFKRLKFESADKRTPIDRLTFNNSGSMTDEQRVNIQRSFEDLLDQTKTDDVAYQIANDLLKYAYFTSGMNFTANSFAHIIPVDAYLNHMRDSSGRTMTNYMYHLEDIANEASTVESITNNFIDQYYRNNYNNKAIVPRINENNFSQRIGNNETILVGKDVTDESLFIKKDKQRIAMPFIAEDLENSTILYIFKGTDPNGNMVFEKTYKLGVPNYVVEYNMNATYIDSIIDSNRVGSISNDAMNYSTSNSTTNTIEENNQFNPPEIPSNKSAEETQKRCKG